MAEGAQHFLDSFKDPEAVARYTEGPKRFVTFVNSKTALMGNSLLASGIFDRIRADTTNSRPSS